MTIQQIFTVCEEMKKDCRDHHTNKTIDRFFWKKYKEHSQKTFGDKENKQSEIDEILKNSDFGEIPKDK